MNITELLDTTRLAELVTSHHISRIVSPDKRHIIYDYTEKATYDRVWTPETTICRGLVVEADTGRIVGRAFDKFHNLNEAGIPSAAIDAVLARGDDYEIWSKFDGSMVLLWWDGYSWRTSTRGSFVSEQARAAHAWIEQHVNAWHLNPTYCYVGEWIGPDNRIVVNYPQHDWVLTAVRNLVTGEEFARDALYANAAAIGVRPCVFWIARGGFDEILAAQSTERGIEGWVLRWPDGFRIKVKTDEYFALHRLISNLTPRRIHEALCTGAYAQYLTALPEEYRPEAERIAGEITSKAGALLMKADMVFADLRPLLAEGRKAFALEAVKHPDVRPYLFLLADDRPIADKVLKDCEPL